MPSPVALSAVGYNSAVYGDIIKNKAFVIVRAPVIQKLKKGITTVKKHIKLHKRKPIIKDLLRPKNDFSITKYPNRTEGSSPNEAIKYSKGD